MNKHLLLIICFGIFLFFTSACGDTTVSVSVNNKGEVTVSGEAEMPAKNESEENSVTIENVTEEFKEFPPTNFPINNCGGVSDVKQEITYSYIHEVVDETKAKLGVGIPAAEWVSIVAEIEKLYGMSDKEITTYSTTLTVPSGQNMLYVVVRKQTWESGLVTRRSTYIATTAAYRILKNETIEVVSSEKLTCP